MKMSNATVGSIILACNTGLGVLAKSFYDNGIVHKVHVVDHAVYPTSKSWYSDDDCYDSVSDLVENIDVLLCFEVPNPSNILDWSVVEACKRLNKKVILMPMYESTPYPIPPQLMPDKWIFPSLLDKDTYAQHHRNGKFIPVPVDVRWKKRTTAKVFVHNAGSKNSQYMDRNGSQVLLAALPHIQSPIKLIFRSRDTSWNIDDERVDFRLGDAPYEELWDEGDAFIFTESYNGLCLPLQESYAAGMLTIAGDRHPVNTWLPKQSLVSPAKEFIVKNDWQLLKVSSYNPIELAKMIDYWYGEDITQYSISGKQWAESNSWSELAKVYKDYLNE